MEAAKVINAELYGIPSGQIAYIWDDIKGYLQNALDRTGAWQDYHIEDIRQGLLNRDYQCWIVAEGSDIILVAITQIVIFPQRKILTIPFVGGQKHMMNSWLPYLEILKDYGQSQGCTAIRGWGRAGWTRVLSPKYKSVEFELEISNENLH